MTTDGCLLTAVVEFKLVPSCDKRFCTTVKGFSADVTADAHEVVID